MRSEPNLLLMQRLTARQRECAELAARGLTSKEIARELKISPSTVDNHINSALLALQLSKRSELSVLFFVSKPLETVAEMNDSRAFFSAAPSDIENEIIRSAPQNYDTDMSKYIREIFIYAFIFVTGSILILFLAITFVLNIIKSFS